ncbi:TPA: type I toxin-antitoxin system toxin MokC [Escherichia coli]|nr:type I toxin-antitoxin system toxin MokC [Escherichia coli]HBA8850015.1 type I toxin-antitoxin system toxin MokC [Escherichia coli]
MLNTCRVPLTDRKVKEKRAMKQHKAMIVICITAVVAALVTRKDLCEVHIRTGQTEVAVFTAYESE